MGPAERQRLNKEVVRELGTAAEHAFNTQKFKEEVMPAHEAAHKEFMRKSPAARRAWHMQEEKEDMTPNDVNDHPEVRKYEHEFMRKTPGMRSAFGEKPNANTSQAMANKGGKKSKRKMHKKMKKTKRGQNKKSKAKKSHKKYATRRHRR